MSAPERAPTRPSAGAGFRPVGHRNRQGLPLLRRDLVSIEMELANLTAAVAGGGDAPTLVTAIRLKESERARLLERMEQVPPKLTPINVSCVLGELQTRLTDWRSLLHSDTPKANGLLKQLIVGRLNLQPDADQRLYRFNGIGTLLPLVDGLMPLVPTERGVPSGIRTRVLALKGPRPRPLDDGDRIGENHKSTIRPTAETRAARCLTMKPVVSK